MHRGYPATAWPAPRGPSAGCGPAGLSRPRSGVRSRPGCAPSWSRSPSRTVRTGAGAARCPRAGSRRPGCQMPGLPGTAAMSAMPVAAPGRAPRLPGSGGSSPLPPTRYPRPSSSPWMRRYPQRGFCLASSSTRARTSSATGGRPGALGYVHVLLTRRRCQASRVPGVTIRCSRRRPGSSPAKAASTARSAQRGLGRATCRRKIATSCRGTRISASFTASLRASSASQPSTRTMNR